MELRLGAAAEAAEVRLDYEGAAQGDAASQSILAFRHEHANGLVQEQAEGLRLYTQAAAQGNSRAQHNAGKCYLPV